MRTIALRISPRAAEVPSSTQSAPYVSPVGINQDAHRMDSRIPLGPRTSSSRSPDMYPHGTPYMPNIPNGRETSPRIPLPPRGLSSKGPRPLSPWYPTCPISQTARRRLPATPSPLAGLLMAPLSVSSRDGSWPLNRWGAACPACTYENSDGAARVCDMCGKSRAHAGSPTRPSAIEQQIHGAHSAL